MIVVSACLAGVNCKYNGKNNLNKEAWQLVSEGRAIPICPEQLGGCGTPRPVAEILEGTGADVLNGKAKVINKNGNNLTDKFIKGAEEALKIVKMTGVKKAILKSMSPSCGYGCIYDGTFSGKIRKGNGVTAELLIQNGVRIICSDG